MKKRHFEGTTFENGRKLPQIVTEIRELETILFVQIDKGVSSSVHFLHHKLYPTNEFTGS